MKSVQIVNKSWKKSEEVERERDECRSGSEAQREIDRETREREGERGRICERERRERR